MRIFEPDVINLDHLKFPMDPRITEEHLRRVLQDPSKKFLADPIPGEVGTSYYVQGWAFPLERRRSVYFGTGMITLLNVMFIDAHDEGKVAVRPGSR